jgi:hypothetical protein
MVDGPRLHALALKMYLAQAVGRPVSLHITDNKHTMISVRPKPGGLVEVRLHRSFLGHGEAVLPLIADFVKNPNAEVRQRMQRFLIEHPVTQPVLATRRFIARPVGKVFNVKDRAAAINHHYFGGAIHHVATWGQSHQRGSPQRNFLLGSWSATDSVLRIHPILDNVAVPRFFLDFVIYHELCHSVEPPRWGKGSRQIHTKDFMKLEERYEYYRLAVEWEKRGLPLLIRNWNGQRSAPLPPYNDTTMAPQVPVTKAEDVRKRPGPLATKEPEKVAPQPTRPEQEKPSSPPPPEPTHPTHEVLDLFGNLID